MVLSCGVVPLSYVWQGLTQSSAVNPLKILVLFLSMTFLSVYLDELGVFEYVASKTLLLCGKNQKRLFISLYIIVSLLTVFTSNDIIVLTFTPFICCFAKRAKIDPVPYLFAEFFAANTWSMFFVIGNPTNIYLATSLGVDFWQYFCAMWLPTIFAGVTSFAIIWLLFRKKLSPIDVCDVSLPVLNKVPVIIGVAHLVVCVVLLSISSQLGIEMWMVTLALSCSLALFHTIYSIVKKGGFSTLGKSFSRLPYQLVPFLLSMFVLVLSLDYTGATQQIASFLAKGNPIFTVGTTSFLVANVINNIPMSVLYGSLSRSFQGLSAMYSAVIGSNLGAFFTPVGALAGIMWLSILKKSQVNVTFKTFVKYGAITSIPALFAALGALCIVA